MFSQTNVCFNRFDNIWCKRDITRIIQSKFEKPYPSWKKTEPAVRDMWFGEFKVMCYFSISILFKVLSMIVILTILAIDTCVAYVFTLLVLL